MLFTGVGLALGATMATIGTVGGIAVTSAFATGLGAAAIAGAGYAVYAGIQGGAKAVGVNMPNLPGQPQAAAKSNQAAQARQVASSRTATIRTSPLGTSGEAKVARQSLQSADDTKTAKKKKLLGE